MTTSFDPRPTIVRLGRSRGLVSRVALVAAAGLVACGGWSAWAGPPAARPDWLLDPRPYRATVTLTDDGRTLEMSNGLLRRRIRVAPNAATVALDHLGTGESWLRAVKPEASVTIDGQRYDVGGLVGQPNRAFLTPEWLDTLTSSPTALQYVGHEIGKPAERITWKRVRHHDESATWPPAGVALRLDFALPTNRSEAAQASDWGRKTLWTETFQQPLGDEWRVERSQRDERILFDHDGKPGAIHALPGTHCFAVRTLDQPAGVVEALIDPGTDRDTSWGPGLLVAFGERRVRVNLRPGDRGEHGHFELRVDGAEQLATVPPFAATDGGLDQGRSYRLRVRVQPDALWWEVADGSRDDAPFVSLFKVPHDGRPATAVGVGKMDRTGGPADAGGGAADDAWTRCRILQVRAFGEFDERAVPQVSDTPRTDLIVSVHYEMYDGLPCYCKWLTVTNRRSQPVVIDRYVSDWLAAVEHTSEVEELSSGSLPPNVQVETEMALGGMLSSGANRRSFRWLADPDYPTQVNYAQKTPCLLEVGPDLGPAIRLPPGETFRSYRGWVMPHDATDRERRGLAVRRLYRTIAPWVTENPLMMHLVAADEASVMRAVDQCADVGFEMLILSFGSGFDVENRAPDAIARARRYAEHARGKGIEIGSYSLLASRSVGANDDVVMPPGQRPAFGRSPCLCSAWGQAYFERLRAFHRETGFMVLEHDGSYPGDGCASTKHPGHRDWNDSRWRQWREIADFYGWCRSEGIYLNVPDYYFLAGSNKTGMGYRETNWSLPRPQQVIHTRQNIYDGTWEKLPSMGWMFVPLTQYHGGGAAATIEPLSEHIDHYGRMLDCNLALGVQACYRGPRLYDSEATRALVRDKVRWFKQHRAILESDLIHGRRADAREPDWMLHVNPALPERGLLVVFNPRPEPVTRTLQVPLYYTGLTDRVVVEDQRAAASERPLDRERRLELSMELPPESMSWWVLRAPE